MNLTNKIKFSSIIISLIIQFLLLQSCFIVKHGDSEQSYKPIFLSPKPEITMSDEIVRSKNGDMIAFLPKDWFFVDVEEKSSSDVFAFAVNPEYTVAAVFSTRRISDKQDEILENEGLLGLARLSMERRMKKTAGAVIQTGKPDVIQMGNLSFGLYEFSSSGGALKSQSAVFISSIGQFYEFSLIPLDFRLKPIPTELEREKIFRSMLSTIQY